jgi:predicted nucleic acid-binding protein
VLQRFFATVVRKASDPMPPEKGLEWINQWLEFPCLAIDHGIVLFAIQSSQRYKISYWDAVILAAAESLGATTVYSEDLNAGHRYSNVQVVNPFDLQSGNPPLWRVLA